jgi:hypothetical protein
MVSAVPFDLQNTPPSDREIPESVKALGLQWCSDRIAEGLLGTETMGSALTNVRSTSIALKNSIFPVDHNLGDRRQPRRRIP